MKIARLINLVFLLLFCLPLIWLSVRFSGDEERSWIGNASFLLLFVGVSVRVLWSFARRRIEGKPVGFLSSRGIRLWPGKSSTSPVQQTQKDRSRNKLPLFLLLLLSATSAGVFSWGIISLLGGSDVTYQDGLFRVKAAGFYTLFVNLNEMRNNAEGEQPKITQNGSHDAIPSKPVPGRVTYRRNGDTFVSVAEFYLPSTGSYYSLKAGSVPNEKMLLRKNAPTILVVVTLVSFFSGFLFMIVSVLRLCSKRLVNVNES